MSRNLRPQFSVLLLVTALLVTPGCRRTGEEVASLEAIRAEAIAAHTRFLADDLLEGRGTGTRGMALAANYAAAHFESLGLEPAGDQGSYFQRISFRKVTLEPEGSALSLLSGGREQRLRFGEDFLMRGHPFETALELTAPLVFAGYGVTAPERNYDDYAGLDARGKIVVLLSGAPEPFPSTVRAHYSSNSVKLENAVAHGAVGVITVWTKKDEQRFPWPRIRRFAGRPSLHWHDAEGQVSDAYPAIRGMAIVNHGTAERLFAGAPASLDEVLAAAAEGKVKGFALPAQARIRMRSRHERVECANVVAVFRGSDQHLREEFVVFSAHLDHEGIGTPLGDDAIYNGALDNASGSAVLFEIARAFAALPQRPRRSVLFLATTAEEEGLLGADYFARHPTVPLDALVANINLDAIPALVATKDFVALGAEHSSLGAVAEAAARELGLELSPDSSPEQNFFIRSDQYPFVKQGVPALFLIPGNKAAEPGVDAAERFQRYLTTIYHTPKDDMTQPLDFQAAATAARINFLIGFRVAEASERPQWNPGDFFGEKFSRR
jgi:Zn-dependent M28 family amino/carboxypeptidase